MDFGVYDIDFTREGRRRVYLFSYLLGYSRRQYLRWVESMDLLTTLREHVHAFHHLGGVARVCLYDNFKAVVLWHDADGPLYNPKFLAFATHYGFRPQACRVRRPQTKGKVERKFFYVETSLLNGRTFDTLEHLNEVTARWLAERRRRPRLARLQGIAARAPCARAAAPVAAAGLRLRHGPGRLSPRQRRGLRHLSVELLLGAVVVHRPGAAGAHHRGRGHHLLDRPGRDRPASPRARHAERRAAAHQEPSSHRRSEPADRALAATLRRAGPDRRAVPRRPASAKQIQGKLQAQQLLALVAQYQRDDVLAALERAVRFGAFSLAAMRRILAAQARPKPLLDELAELHKDALDPSLRQEPIGPRPPATTSTCSHPRKPMKRRPTKNRQPLKNQPSLRDQILADFATLRVPVTAEQLDEVLKQAQDAGWSHLEFLHRLLADQAGLRRQRRIERLIKEAHFREALPLDTFDWNFNPAIPRLKIEALAQGDFIRRKQNVVFVGQSGLGKSRLIQSIGLAACMLEQRVRYVTSGELLEDLTAALADQTIHDRVRFYAKFSLLIIDEFGFDRTERSRLPGSRQPVVQDHRRPQPAASSTALVTNIDFESWAEYLGDAAAGDGHAGPRGRRRDDREAERQILSRASRRRRADRQVTVGSTPSRCPFTSPGNSLWPPPSRETGPLLGRDQQTSTWRRVTRSPVV